ncbi:hypothetical protein QW060_21500 [Myroides ceti]|uniref:Uncharacterized protein n=1 Tax=Paenimyroides ceti TaxID=395087 RepID=A0ABT8D108_9FLAO|nr:hypothetical protein [Paenimyroides ceti]MDN3709553.1 hypothetical protein [Paenimyroides ceti]
MYHISKYFLYLKRFLFRILPYYKIDFPVKLVKYIVYRLQHRQRNRQHYF